MGEIKITKTVNPYELRPEETPAELSLQHYIGDVSSFKHRDVFTGRFCWDTLDNIGKYIQGLPPEVDVQIEKELKESAKVINLRDGAITGNILIEEGAEVEPYVTLKAASGGGIYIGKKAKVQSFSRIEALEGEFIYIGEGAKIAPGCDIAGSICIGEGSILADSVLHGKVHIGKETHLCKVVILGPSLVGDHCDLRPGAFLRENSLLGNHIEFRSETKNAILMDGLKEKATAAAHYAYIGDSILGRGVNLGAGTKTSNLKVDRSVVNVILGETKYPTGRIKFGAVIGEGVETGCLTVFDPGALVGPNTLTYPGTSVRGYYPPNSIVKLRQTLQVVERR